MKLTFYRHPKAPNFGDELNPWLWPRLLGSLLDDEEQSLFIGIGSILHDRYPTDARKIVMGAGYGAYHPPPAIDPSWSVHFVRGPQTAQRLGLPASAAVTDGAVLVRTAFRPDVEKRYAVSYMPHWESLYTGPWAKACQWAGVHLIDPRQPVETVLHEIAASKVLMAEAMHGAIVADALRVPWIPILPIDEMHRFKWTDWTQSLDLDYRPRRHLPSGPSEWAGVLEQGDHGRTWRRGLARAVRALPDGAAQDRSMAGKAAGHAFAAAAAASLWVRARGEPMLSRDSVIESRTDQAIAKLDAFRKQPCAAL